MEYNVIFLGMRLPDGTHTKEIPPEVIKRIRQAFMDVLHLEEVKKDEERAG